MMRSLIRAGAVVAACGLAYAACRTFGPSVERSEQFSYAKPVAGHNAIRLVNVNGTVTITGVDGLDKAQISGVKTVGASSGDEAAKHLNDLTIAIDESGTTLSVETMQSSIPVGRNYSVNYDIKVPRGWLVDVDNTNGDVTISAGQGGVKVDLTNGDLALAQVKGALAATVTNGSITGDASVPASSNSTVETTNGSIHLRMNEGIGMSAHLETTNGGITLEVPRSTSAVVTAEAGTGDVVVQNLPGAASKAAPGKPTAAADDEDADDSDDDDDDHGIGVGDSYSATLGKGGGSLTLETTNGGIELKGF